MGTLYYIVYILTAIDTALTPPSNTKYHIILIQVEFLVKVLVIICLVNGACRAKFRWHIIISKKNLTGVIKRLDQRLMTISMFQWKRDTKFISPIQNSIAWPGTCIPLETVHAVSGCTPQQPSFCLCPSLREGGGTAAMNWFVWCFMIHKVPYQKWCQTH